MPKTSLRKKANVQPVVTTLAITDKISIRIVGGKRDPGRSVVHGAEVYFMEGKTPLTSAPLVLNAEATLCHGSAHQQFAAHFRDPINNLIRPPLRPLDVVIREVFEKFKTVFPVHADSLLEE